MKEQTTEDRTDISVLAWYELQVTRAQELVQSSKDRLAEARGSYAVAHPLTEAERNELVARVAGGGSLCCADGLAWLKDRFSQPWADSLNEWAYDALSCSDDREETRARAVEKVRALRLDRFPR